jgi:CheY-like chemotaxis protein
MSAQLRILLVEDNEGDVELTQRALRDSERTCTLTVAEDGAAALEQLRASGDAGAARPQLILLDLNMPRMGGKRFLEIVKQDAQLKSIPVVVLTSSQSPNDIRECYERHASCYVVKPFDGAEYMHIVRQVIGHWSEVAQLP